MEGSKLAPKKEIGHSNVGVHRYIQLIISVT